MPDQHPRAVPRSFQLHWGAGHIVEEATVVGEYHEPAIQLLEFSDGSLSVRFCYYDHEGRFQRSPLILGQAELPALRAALERTPRLRAVLRQLLV